MEQTSRKRGRNASSLAEANPFDWDDAISFSEEGHLYHVHGKKAELSVTALVKTAFPSSAAFDGRRICEANLSKWRTNANNKYYSVVADIPDDEDAIAAVQALWDRNRDLGTLAHKMVELVVNQELPVGSKETNPVRRELDQFLEFQDARTLAGWSARRTELALYHTREDGTTIAGMIDLLYQDAAGQLRVVDLKRSDKVLTPQAPNFGKMGAGAAASLKDTDYYRYSLQCWLYSLMLKDLSGMEVGAPLLVQVHPTQNSAKVIHCQDLEDVARNLLDGA